MSRDTILIADDDRVTVQVLTSRFKAAGFNVVPAYDAMQAVMAALRNPPTAVVLDIGMPGGTGHEVLKKLKSSAKTSTVPIVVISASTDSALPATVKEHGADEFLPKPVDFDLLHHTLRHLLGKPEPAK